MNREALPPGPFAEGGAAQGDRIPPRPRHGRSARWGNRTPVAMGATAVAAPSSRSAHRVPRD
ncbi:hypothetical protein RADP37_04217 [Roseomonas mucosa]|uniref:Uncharacterized protein n=1 Tax=Roseomonas mucosa TaxID=207340 RepID=A0A4Y1MVN5_9PROT|nr:hypothetical protein RADP37_04217 [Roseomonas mucosa]